MQALHTLNAFMESLYAHFTHQCTVLSLGGNKWGGGCQEGNGRDVTIIFKENFQIKYRMSDFQREKLFFVYQNTKQVLLPMDYVCMCFDLTQMLPVRKE
jgi:hypothetical protein